MKIEAASRLVSELSNQEKITHYKKMLNKVNLRLHKLDPKKTPYAYKRNLNRFNRLTERIQMLTERHRY